MRHALDGDNWDLSYEVLQQFALHMIDTGGHSTVETWCNRFPVDVPLAWRVDIAFIRAWLGIVDGDLDAVRSDADRSRAGRGSTESPEQLAEQVDATNRLLVRHNRALAQIDKAERAAARSALRVRDLKQQLRSRTTAPELTTAAEVLALIAPVAEQVLSDVGGSLPIAVVGDLAGLPEAEVEAMMGAIEEVAEQVQVIMVTGHDGIGQWAERAGLERAGLTTESRTLA